MAANTVTYFGDVTTVGNTVVAQNLTSQGNYSIFTGNVSPSVISNVGSVAAPWNVAYLASANVTRANVSSIFGTVGVNVASDSSTNLRISGNVSTTNTLVAQNVIATTSANTQTLNTSSIAGGVGINSSGVAAGPQLLVSGNIWSSNAISAQKVFVTTSNLNAGFLNTSAIYGTSGSVGINTAGLGANLNVSGNIWSSNAFSTPNIFATSANVISILNTSAIYGTSGSVGINTAGLGANLNVLGNIWISNGMTTTNLMPSMNANIVTTNVTFMNLYILGVGINTTAQAGGSLPLVKVSGNVRVSNSFQTLSGIFTNVLTVTSNLGPNATNQIFSPATGGIVGVAQVPTAGSATLQVTGNIWVSNALQSSNIALTTSANSVVSNITSTAYSVGINKTSPTSTLDVSGNVWVTENVTATGIPAASAVTSNVPTLNVLSISGTVGIGTSTNLNSTLTVPGNVQISNSLWTTSSFGTTSMNVSGQVNTSAIYGTAGLVGFNTSVTVGGPPLQFLGDNIYASNSISTTNIFATTANIGNLFLTSYTFGTTLTATSLVTSNISAGNALVTTNIYAAGTIYYGEDTTTRSIHLTPTAANTTAIQSWISVSCNASSQPSLSYWSTSQTPLYSNVAVGPSGNAAYSGSVFLPDGRVLFVPYVSSTIGFFNPATSIFSTVVPTGFSGSSNFNGGVLLPTGNVLFAPQTSNVGLFSPVDYTFSNSTAIPGGTYNAVLASTGVILAPQGTPSNVINYNFTTGAISNVLALSAKNFGNVTLSAGTMTANLSWFSVAWSPQLGLFVAIAGGSSTMNYSTDGKNWLPGTMTSSQNWRYVVWSPQLGLFVAVAGVSNVMNYSTDGKNWSAGSMTSSQNWRSVVWSPQLGLFVAIAKNTSVMNYSTDGKNWSAGSMNTSQDWNTVEWSPQLGLFVAIANVSNVMNYSTDGKNWSPGSTTIVQGWNTVTWSPQLGLFIVLCNGADLNYSYDGKTWFGTTTIGTNWQTIIWSPQLGIFVAVSTSTTSLYSTRISLQQGACLLTNGNVIVPSPGTANVIQFDPVGLISSNIVVGTDGFNSLTLAPNGNVIGTPMSSNIIVINPSTGKSSNINTQTQTSFGGACLLPSGNIIFTPTTANVGMFDPVALAYSNSAASGGNFSGATLIPTGQVVFCPSGSANVGLLDTLTPTSSEFCLSPYFNKF